MKWFFFTSLAGAICIAIFSLPQLIKILKTKNTTSVPMLMFILLLVGDLMFFVSSFGMMASDGLSGGLPIFITNLIGSISSGWIICYKIRNRIWAKKLNMTEQTFCENWHKNRQKIRELKPNQQKKG